MRKNLYPSLRKTNYLKTDFQIAGKLIRVNIKIKYSPNFGFGVNETLYNAILDYILLTLYNPPKF